MRDNYHNNERYFKKHIQDSYKYVITPIQVEAVAVLTDSVYSDLDERIRNNKQFVLYVPENHCKDCFLQEYEKLENMPSNDFSNNIIILSNYRKIRDLKAWTKSQKITYPIYNLNRFDSEFISSLTKISYFVLDQSLIPQHVFVPLQGFQELSDEYYSFAKELFHVPSNDSIYSEIRINKKRHDFGNVKLDETVYAEFVIENKSDDPLVILEIKTTCGCTAAEWYKKPINKNESNHIKVEFKADQLGYFSKKIIVYSNAPGSPHHLSIVGKVENI